jgi:aspartate/methionine/tyrosine aminotransferase
MKQAMRIFRPFAMERWQSTWENRVDYNLSESGVHPLTVGELLSLSNEADIDRVLLGYGQSNGSDELRARIAQLVPGASADNVMVTNGSAEANFVAIWELAGAGDEVAILTPTYMQTHGLAETLGATIREIPLREAAGWQPDPDEILNAVNDRTRVIVVTNPNNPTGAILDAAARHAVLRASERSGAWILADEVYTGAELDGHETPSFFGNAERVITTGSLSKAYGLPGLRIGWCISDAETAERLWARTDYTTISPGDLTDALACTALRPEVRARLLERTRGILHRGLAQLETWMNELGIFQWRPPDAGAICFARYDLPIESGELAERLRVEQSVLIVPGMHFGMEHFIRFGYGIEEDALHEALRRVAQVLGTAGITAR